jgi:hypothetical protein
MNAFIKDWYALMTADWIDSAIVGAVLNAEDLEFYLPSEISLGRKDATEFNILPENFLKTDVKLSYTCVEIPVTEVTKIINNSRRRNTMNKDFLSRLENWLQGTGAFTCNLIAILRIKKYVDRNSFHLGINEKFGNTYQKIDLAFVCNLERDLEKPKQSWFLR